MKSAALLFLLGATACSSKSPAPQACALSPDLTADECTTLHALSLDVALPPSPGNARADDADAAAMGFKIFFDARFSANQNVRCATCHAPEEQFDDAKPVSTGLQDVSRNSPTAFNAARMTTYFWDGRADSLWSQPLFAFENPKEMGFSRLEIAHRVMQSYEGAYEAIFGPLPALDDGARFPAAGKPGDAAFDGMAPADQDAVNRVAVNVGKSLEAYVRKLASSRAPFDRFVDGDPTQLTDPQKRGLVTFVRSGCLDCHSGAMMTDESFHNLGVPAWDGAEPDRGRIDGIATLTANPFNLHGAYADQPSTGPLPVATDADLGAFRTPTLRNVSISAPYAHNGRFASLDEVVAFHLAGGGRGAGGFVGDVDARLVKRDLTPDQQSDLVSFLDSLKGDYPALPWSDWPQK